MGICSIWQKQNRIFIIKTITISLTNTETRPDQNQTQSKTFLGFALVFFSSSTLKNSQKYAIGKKFPLPLSRWGRADNVNDIIIPICSNLRPCDLLNVECSLTTAGKYHIIWKHEKRDVKLTLSACLKYDVKNRFQFSCSVQFTQMSKYFFLHFCIIYMFFFIDFYLSNPF